MKGNPLDPLGQGGPAHRPAAAVPLPPPVYHRPPSEPQHPPAQQQQPGWIERHQEIIFFVHVVLLGIFVGLLMRQVCRSIWQSMVQWVRRLLSRIVAANNQFPPPPQPQHEPQLPPVHLPQQQQQQYQAYQPYQQQPQQGYY